MKNLKAIILTVFLVISGLFTFSQEAELSVKIKLQDIYGRPMKNTLIEFVETNSRKRFDTYTDETGIAEQIITGGKYYQIQIKDIRKYYKWQFKMPAGSLKGSLSMTMTYHLDHYLWEITPKTKRDTIKIVTEKQKNQPRTVSNITNGLVKVVLKNRTNTSVAGIDVNLFSAKLKKLYTTKTNSNGEAIFLVPYGYRYNVDVDGVNNFNYTELTKKKGTFAVSTLNYVPTKITEEVLNDTVTQQLPKKLYGTTARELVTLTVVKNGSEVYPNETVYLNEIGGTLVYTTKTNSQGKAIFMLPKGKKYMIHFDYQKDIDVFDLTRTRGVGHSNKTRTYHPDPRLEYPETFLPEPESLYLKEFKSFLTKEFKHLDSTKALGFKAYFGEKVNTFSREAVLNIELTSTQNENLQNTPPINLAFVIDKSGSMAGYERIENLKSAMSQLINKLRPEDQVSITIFDHEETLIISSQKLGHDKRLILDEIVKIEADGGTNIYAGLKEGFAQARKQYKKGMTNRVVLLTDGYGTTPVDTIVDFVKEQRAKGIECSVVGVGYGYNVSLLKQLATVGGGLTSLVGHSKEMHSAFLAEFKSLIRPVAKDAKVEIEYNKRIVFSQLYGFDATEKRSEKKAVIKLPNIYAGFNDIAMVRFNLKELDRTIEDEPVIVRIKYFDLVKNEWVKLEQKIVLEWSDFEGELEMQKDIEQKKMYAIAVMNQSLKVIAESKASGDYSLAINTTEQTLASMKKSFPTSSDQDISALKVSLENYLDLMKNMK